LDSDINITKREGPFVKFALILFVIVLSLTPDREAKAANALTLEEAQQLRAILDAPPPNARQTDRVQLAQIYLQRGKAARELGDSERALKEFRIGLNLVGPMRRPSYDLHREIGRVYFDRGDLPRAIEARKAALAAAQETPLQLRELCRIALFLATLEKREEAKEYLSRAEGVLSAARTHKSWLNRGHIWTSWVAETKGQFNQSFGYLAAANENFRECSASMRTNIAGAATATDSSYLHLVYCTRRWIEVAVRQGRLREASAFVDDLRQMSKDYADAQGRPLIVSLMAPGIAAIYIEESRFTDAQNILLDSIQHFRQDVDQSEEIGELDQVARSRELIAAIEMLQGNWEKAEETHRQTNRGTVEWGYTLLRLGRIEESLKVFETILQRSNKVYDENSLYLWENRAFHALAVGESGKREEAVKTLSLALPKILEMSRPQGTSGEAGLLNTARLNWLLDGYIAFLADIYKSGAHVEGVDIVGEAFRYSDMARASRVQGALSAAILRASISDPTLAAVIRRSQDLEYQVKATAEYLTALQSGESNPEKEKLMAYKRAELERLRTENEQAQEELKRKLPDYSELLSPKPLSITDTQKFLRPQEALISIYSSEKSTLVWSVPPQGKPAFAVVDLSAARMSELVSSLRKGLDPSDVQAAQIPFFEYTAAHELFLKLLAPIQAGWDSAKELIIVPHGALGQLPFSVLVTAPYKPTPATMLFAEHGDAPWLLKRAAISYLPSVAALGTLRRTATQKSARSFIGFADPIFSGSQGTASLTRGVDRRFLKRSSPEATATQSSPLNLSLLESLPDTATEVGEIAKILNADEKRDIFLGQRASEQVLKSTDLAQYRIVMLATHGLTAGELPGLDQPALALSNPTVTGEKEDGVLMLNEILALKLNADWVVLSACNTASSDGKAAEGVSGLGRAFFYAGAKALLVSHWPVETVSARLLTTEIFRQQTTNANLSRAEAMRQSSLALMQQTRDGPPSSAYSYAHPMFWAPFVVVGDGG